MKLLVLGFGNVGRALIRILPENGFEASICNSKGGIKTMSLDELKKAADEVKSLPSQAGYLVFNPQKAVESWDYDVLVDLTPTNLDDAEPSKTYWKIAFNRGKSVVTANKGPLALNFREMTDAARRQKNASLLFEATVAGGTPVFCLAKNCLRGGKLTKIEGILNGTTNYILTQMKAGKTFEEALQEAQDKGYAEADPTYDVKGMDALAKAVILANAIFGKNVSFKDLEAEGIDGITLEMVRKAEEQGECYKLIASIDENNVSVSPKRISCSHPLAAVGNAWNALTFYTKNADAITITGKGAGGLPTASAVLNDIMELKSEGN